MTLTQAASLSRKAILITIILLVMATVGGVGYTIWHQQYLASLPPKEEIPEKKFGTLPPIKFPDSAISSSNYSYSLDTTTGGLPTDLSKVIKVYFIPQAGISLLAPEKSTTLAQNLGFNNGPEKVTENLYKFYNDTGGSLTVNLSTGNFHLQKGEATPSAEIVNITLPPQEEIQNSFKNYLSRLDLLASELQNSRSKVIFDNTDQTNSENAEVSLWPADVNNLPIVTSYFNQGLIKAVISNTTDEKNRFTNIDYTYWPIDQSTFSTYPLKSAEQAFTELKSGGAFIALEPTAPQISLSSVYLAYFESEEYSPYLLPVFVFEGPGFAALVPAIDPNK